MICLSVWRTLFEKPMFLLPSSGWIWLILLYTHIHKDHTKTDRDRGRKKRVRIIMYLYIGCIYFYSINELWAHCAAYVCVLYDDDRASACLFACLPPLSRSRRLAQATCAPNASHMCAVCEQRVYEWAFAFEQVKKKHVSVKVDRLLSLSLFVFVFVERAKRTVARADCLPLLIHIYLCFACILRLRERKASCK